jgi:hypothetical protein
LNIPRANWKIFSSNFLVSIWWMNVELKPSWWNGSSSMKIHVYLKMKYTRNIIYPFISSMKCNSFTIASFALKSSNHMDEHSWNLIHEFSMDEWIIFHQWMWTKFSSTSLLLEETSLGYGHPWASWCSLMSPTLICKLIKLTWQNNQMSNITEQKAKIEPIQKSWRPNS